VQEGFTLRIGHTLCMAMPWVLVHNSSEVPISNKVARLLRDGLDTAESGRDLIARIRGLATAGETRIELSDDEADAVRKVLDVKLQVAPPDLREEINRRYSL
jgi:hypothetical protein